ncbi:regulator with hipB [uncultured spirochete]|uniref:Regulator with hipB n=1 Tax=uncultured spirochete TaxID=156406 RepID=A0A3P3XQE4_9SPIR|nr:regulator with hipB [uncultured spirochete]
MGRKSKTKGLVVWMNGERVGVWSILPSNIHEFRYDGSWLEFPDVRPISLSMPIVTKDYIYKGQVVEAFFENLLPDSVDIRRRLQRRFSVETDSAFDLLAQIGRDCVGAIQLLPEGESPQDVRTISAEPLDEAGVARILRQVVASSGFGQAGDDDFRISIAGVQEKTALLWNEGQWCKPMRSTPSSHIFKLPLGFVGVMQADMSDSVENEWLCAKIVEAFSLPVAHCDIADFEDQHVLIVERFDRRLSADRRWWIRLPQEDMCQATGTPPGAKYENEGGPGMVRIMDLLIGSRNALVDRRNFLKAQVLYWLLAAPDGHAKNFSIFLEPQGRFSLTPLYDVLSSYPILGHGNNKLAPQKLTMAMSVFGKDTHKKWAHITASHWRTTASKCRAQGEIEGILHEVIEETPKAIEAVSSALPDGFPSTVSEPILEGIQVAVERLRKGIVPEV